MHSALQKQKHELLKKWLHSYPENLQFPTLNVPIIANFSPATKKVPTVGSNANLFFITLDEKSGAEKKTSTQVLVQAADLRDAVKKLDEGMKGTMADYQIGMVSETPLMDVYPYSAGPNDKPEFDPSKA